MPEQKPVFKEQTNIPVSIKIQNWDNPSSKEGQWGLFYILNILKDGSEMVWFLSEKKWESIKKDVQKNKGLITFVQKEVSFGGKGNAKVLKIINDDSKEAEFSKQLDQSINLHAMGDKNKLQMERDDRIRWGLSWNVASRIAPVSGKEAIPVVEEIAKEIYKRTKDLPTEDD